MKGSLEPKGITSQAIVIEVFDADDKHSVVTVYVDFEKPLIYLFADENGDPFVGEIDGRYYFLYVRRPNVVEFGDILRYDSKSTKWTLNRGPFLSYSLTLDPIPKSILKQLLIERGVVE